MMLTIKRNTHMKRFVAMIGISLLLAGVLKSQTDTSASIELVESVPVGTILDNPDIRNATDVWREMIDAATSSLEIEQFYISPQAGEPLDDILAAIDRAAGRGVNVRIIVDSRMYRTYPATVDAYRAAERSGASPTPVHARVIDFRKVAGGIQHAKFFIVDGEEIYLGSQNFDWRSLKHIHELGIRLRHREAVAAYREVFEYDWTVAADTGRNAAGRIRHHAVAGLPYIIAGNAGDTIRFYPTMSPRTAIPDTTLWDETHIRSLLGSAATEIDLQFLSYSAVGRDKQYYDALDGSIRRAAGRGVHVRLLVSDWEKGAPGDSTLKELAKIPNIEVKFSAIPDWSGGYIPFGRVEHCKFIIVDGSTFWLGTSNGEKSYFHTSRNLGIVVQNRLLATRLKEIFLKSWNGPYVEPVLPSTEYLPRKHGEE
jgi:phosphatidylserine/phosphatidylglycerophosphate/cardiolipin synthase-like enzyme